MTQDAPSCDQAVASVHNQLFFRLFQAGNTLDRQTAKAPGITTMQWSVPGAPSRPQAAQGMSFSELADYLVVSRQSLDGVLKRLERDGHVLRVADTVDRRAKKVVLTGAGKVFWEGLRPRVYEFYRQALAGFRFDDKVSLVHFLNQLNKGMNEIDMGGPAAARSVK